MNKHQTDNRRNMTQLLIIFAVSQLMTLRPAQSSSSAYGNNMKEIQKGFNDIESSISELVKNKDALGKTFSRISNEKCGQCGVVYKRLDCDCRKLNPKKDCLAFYNAGYRHNGLYLIFSGSPFKYQVVYCDQTSRGGGWTVIQRRQDGSISFEKKWDEYKAGFGNIRGEFWLGNDNIYRLTKAEAAPKSSLLLISMKTYRNKEIPVFALYSKFRIDNEAAKYKLYVSGHSGNITDQLKYHNGMKFSTKDQDNDASPNSHCSVIYGKGGWWYRSCYECSLNGNYNARSFKGIKWNPLAASFVEMKIRRIE